MHPIDLVKHQTRILPGLEEAAHAIIGRLNEARKILKLPALLLTEDPNEKAHYIHYITLSREAAEEIRQSAIRHHKRKAEANAARERIRETETKATDRRKLKEFRHKLKTGTLIERPAPAIEAWEEGSSIKPARPL